MVTAAANMVATLLPITLAPVSIEVTGKYVRFTPTDWLTQIMELGHRGITMGPDDGWVNYLLAYLEADNSGFEMTRDGKVYDTEMGVLTLVWNADKTECMVYFVSYDIPPRFPPANETALQFAMRTIPIIDRLKVRVPMTNAIIVPGWASRTAA